MRGDPAIQHAEFILSLLRLHVQLCMGASIWTIPQSAMKSKYRQAIDVRKAAEVILGSRQTSLKC